MHSKRSKKSVFKKSKGKSVTRVRTEPLVIDLSKYTGKAGAKRLRSTKKRAVFDGRGFLLKGTTTVQFQTSPGKTGLKASQLIENKKGKIVSKVKSELAVSTYGSRSSLIEQATKMKMHYAK